ncbi:MAG: thioredoxin domain-containing protein [Pseudohongiellaceae bacterium]
MNESPIHNSIEEELRDLEASKVGGYDKRTEHLNEDGSAVFINRLIREDSPYLLQHAHNPVNWYPWGGEAFEIAKQEHKPIFLSIGYSTCHWCHVMEVESFDNVEIAKVLNEHFISIKMDREQYPDIDEAYMTGVQLMSGHGGWPMSNFMLNDGRPFFGATYFPPPTFMKLLQQIVEAWNEKFDELESSATKIGEAIDRILSERKKAASLEPEINNHVTQALFQREDRSLGGLAGAPKFPQEPLLLFMLDHGERHRHVNAVEFASRSIEAMGRGGIYDQVAGGFHRYSVDAEWLVPHFEKMLYNQSQLSLVNLHAYRVSGNPFFKRVLFQTLEYVLRDMQLPEGGFYSATDADSEGAEGVFFLWSVEQLQDALSKDEAKLIVDVFGVSESGNFEGSNILNFSKTFADHEEQFGPEFENKLDSILKKLYQVREQRIHPLRDDKLIVAWSSAMITSLAKAGDYFSQKHWIAAAEKAIDLTLSNNLDGDGTLRRIYLDGTTSIEGQLEDYANLIEALISLFDITSAIGYLQQANNLMSSCIDGFWDEKEMGFFLSPSNQVGPQLTRSRSASDGATFAPAATALACLISLRDRSAYLEEGSQQLFSERAEQCISSLVGEINNNAVSHTSMLRQLANYYEGNREPIQYMDHGLAKVKARTISGADTLGKSISLIIDIADGWHVTAPTANLTNYMPLSVCLAEDEKHWVIDASQFPDNESSMTTVEGDTIPIYENKIEIALSLKRTQVPDDELSFSSQLECELQLCNDQRCLLPTSITFRI